MIKTTYNGIEFQVETPGDVVELLRALSAISPQEKQPPERSVEKPPAAKQDIKRPVLGLDLVVPKVESLRDIRIKEFMWAACKIIHDKSITDKSVSDVLSLIGINSNYGLVDRILFSADRALLLGELLEVVICQQVAYMCTKNTRAAQSPSAQSPLLLPSVQSSVPSQISPMVRNKLKSVKKITRRVKQMTPDIVYPQKSIHFNSEEIFEMYDLLHWLCDCGVGRGRKGMAAYREKHKLDVDCMKYIITNISVFASSYGILLEDVLTTKSNLSGYCFRGKYSQFIHDKLHELKTQTRTQSKQG